MVVFPFPFVITVASSGSLHDLTRDWIAWSMFIALYVGLGLCLAKGLAWARFSYVGLIACVLMVGLWAQFFTIGPIVRPKSTPLLATIGMSALLISHVVAIGLCFLPDANAYFRQSSRANRQG